MHARRSSRFIAGVLFAVGLIVVLVNADYRGNKQNSGNDRASRTDLLRGAPAAGCSVAGIAATTVHAASQQMPYSIPMPRSTSANSASVAAIYLCSATNTVIDFRSGIAELIDVSSSDDATAADGLKGFVANDSEEASLGTVHGHVAAVIDPAKDPSGYAAGSVTFVENGVWLCVLGNHRLSAADLVEVAQSLPTLGMK